MGSTISSIPFAGTPEQEKQLLEVIAAHKTEKGCLMPILQKAQEIYGYLPIEVQTMIAEEMGIPLEKVYGVATFYSFFSLQPKGKYKISVCLGTACYVKGSSLVLNKIEEILGVKAGESSDDGLYSVEATRCIGACGLAPVMTINEDVYGKVTPDEVEAILAMYK